MSDSTDGDRSVQRELERLEQLRDQLRVKMHLAAADARDEFDRLERKWLTVEQELNRVGDHARTSIEEMRGPARTLLDELKKGYARVKDSIKD